MSSPRTKSKDFTHVLVDNGIITAEQREAAERERVKTGTKETLTSILRRKYEIPDQVLYKIAAEYSGIGWIDDLGGIDIPQDIAMLIPSDNAKNLKVLPIRRDGDTIVIATPSFASKSKMTSLTSDIRALLGGRSFTFVGALESEIVRKTATVYRNEGEIAKLMGRVRDREIEPTDAAKSVLEMIVNQAITDQASDIHIEADESVVYVRYRIDGVLHEKTPLPRAMHAPVLSVLKDSSELDVAKKDESQDGRWSVTHDGRKVDLRVSTLPAYWGEKGVMRILEGANAIRPLKDFSFSPLNMKRWSDAYTKPQGLVVVTGPTGSGKSTTLYATLNEIASSAINIQTIEDPIEYQVPHITQTQVSKRPGMDFPGVLRSILRQDPDVILVGEMRDKETAQIAIEAALTGHLVLSTLHTNDAPSTAMRLIEMGIEPFLVASTLRCVLAQRLARRLCTFCREPYELSQPERDSTGFILPPEMPERVIYRARGCARCRETGYKGRVALHETMVTNPEIEVALTKDGVNARNLNDLAKRHQMRPLREDGWIKVSNGETTIEEVLRVIG